MQPYGRPPSSPTTSRDTKATISVSSYFCIGRTLIGGFIERGAPIKRRQLARIFRANLLHGSPRYFDAPQGQRTKTTLFVSDTAKNTSGKSEVFLFRKE